MTTSSEGNTIHVWGLSKAQAEVVHGVVAGRGSTFPLQHFAVLLMTSVLCPCNLLGIHQRCLFLPDLLLPSSHSGRTASTTSASGTPNSSATLATSSPTALSWETPQTWS